MSLGLVRGLKKRALISFALSFVLVMTSWPYRLSAQTSDSSEIPTSSSKPQELPPSIEKALMELELAKEGELPSNRRNIDSFHLLGQSLKVLKGHGTGTYNLSREDIVLPQVVVTDFVKQVTVTSDRATNELQLVFRDRHDEVFAIHAFPHLKVISYTMDRELLIILTTDGTVMAMDIGYLRDYAFKSPLPVIELLKTQVTKDFGNSLHLSFIQRQQEPILPVKKDDPRTLTALDQPMKAGDVVIWQTEGQNRQGLYHLNREVIQTQLYTAEALISMMAFQLDPSPEKEGVMAGVSMVTRESLDDSRGLTQLYHNILLQLPHEAVHRLMQRSFANKMNTQKERDEFSFLEWQAQFAKDRQSAELALQQQKITEAQETKKNKAVSWRRNIKNPAQLFHGVMTRKAMVRMAAIISVGAIGFGLDQFEVTGQSAELALAHFDEFKRQSLAWGTHFVNQVYSDYLGVLKDPAYRWTLLKSSVALGAFVPLIYAVSQLYGKVKGISWSAQKNVAIMSMRVWGMFALPFWHRLAKLFRQPNFLRSLRMGIDPFRSIAPESPVGRALKLDKSVNPAFMNPFLSEQKFKKSLNEKTKVQNAIYQQKARKRSLAWALALQTVSEEYKIDPVSLGTLMDFGVGSLNEAQLENITSNEAFKKKWQENAEELSFHLIHLNSNEWVPALDNMDTKQLGYFYRTAKDVSEKIKSRSRLARAINGLKIQWYNFSEKATVWVGSVGVSDYEFLKRAEPSQLVVSQFWKQFVLDYLLSVGQVALVGSRAHLWDPQALAAREGHFLWTSPGHRYDMLEQVRIYMINEPARLALVYQSHSELTEDAYDPVERNSLKGHETSETFGQGMWEWTKDAMNLMEANYGGLVLRDLLKRIRSIQANMIFALSGRMILGSQVFKEAFFSAIYTTIWSTWKFGWMWFPVIRGNQMYGQRLETLQERFIQAKAKLGRSLRKDDLNEIKAASQELAALYATGGQANDELQRSVEEGFQFLSQVEPQQIENIRSEAALTRNALLQLQMAITSGDVKELESAREAVLALYENETVPAERALTPLAQQALAKTQLAKLSGIDLLIHALKNPPFATKAHPAVEWTTTMVVAVLTTWLGTDMFTETFRENVPWETKLPVTFFWSALLYTGTYGAQKVLIQAKTKLTEWKEKRPGLLLCRKKITPK